MRKAVVSFNDREGSTKCYKFTREHEVEVAPVDFVPHSSILRFRKTDGSYNATDRNAAYTHPKQCIDKDEVATGLFFLDENVAPDLHELNKTVARPLVDVP